MLAKTIVKSLNAINHDLLIKSLQREPVEFDMDVCPDCGSDKFRMTSRDMECLGCGSTFILK